MSRIKNESITDSSLVIDLVALDALNKKALESDVLIRHPNLNYRQAQQALTIESLIKYIESFGLSSPVKLDLNGISRND